MLFMCIQKHSYLLAFQTDVLTIFFGVQAQQRICADSKPGSTFLLYVIGIVCWVVVCAGCAKNTGRKDCSRVSEPAGPENSSLKVIMHEKDAAWLSAWVGSTDRLGKPNQI